MVSLRARCEREAGLRQALEVRARVIQDIRDFFNVRGFLEVSTPALMPAADPAVHLESFTTTLTLAAGPRIPLYLPTSPEHHMKRLVAAGFSRIYQVCPFFRDGELTPLHNPEFTGLEWYQVGTDAEAAMKLTEALVCHLAARHAAGPRLFRLGRSVELRPPFERVPLREAFARFGGITLPERWDPVATRATLRGAGIPVAPDDSFDDMVNRGLLERVEPKLAEAGPLFITEYPAPMAALAKLLPDRPWVAERFELYALGLELCNGYGELVDPAEQRWRFEADRSERIRRGLAVPPLDEAFLTALEEGLPPCSGCALGVDRLLMVLLGKERIEDVLAFPHALELPLGDDQQAGLS